MSAIAETVKKVCEWANTKVSISVKGSSATFCIKSTKPELFNAQALKFDLSNKTDSSNIQCIIDYIQLRLEPNSPAVIVHPALTYKKLLIAAELLSLYRTYDDHPAIQQHRHIVQHQLKKGFKVLLKKEGLLPYPVSCVEPKELTSEEAEAITSSQTELKQIDKPKKLTPEEAKIVASFQQSLNDITEKAIALGQDRRFTCPQASGKLGHLITYLSCQEDSNIATQVSKDIHRHCQLEQQHLRGAFM